MRITITKNHWMAAVFAGVVLSWSAFAPLFAGELVRKEEPARGGGTIAWQKGDTVFVAGTRAGDRIVIHRSGDKTVAGEVEVWDVGVSPSVVLGIFSGVVNLDVDLLGGDNFLGLYHFDVPGDVAVACTDGNDQVYLGGVGDGPENKTSIDGEFTVDVGDGNDEVRMEQCSLGDVVIDAGEGNNVVLFGHHLQPGQDAYTGQTFATVSVLCGSGDDLVAMLGCEFGSVAAFDTQGGDDWVLFGLGLVGGELTIGGNETHNVAVDVGHGDDLVAFFYTDAYGDVAVSMGNQQDSVWLGGFDAPNDFHEELAVDGGPGNDELYDDPANSYAVPPELTSFETVSP